MIVRMWSGTARPEHADAYVAHLREKTLPALAGIPGYYGANVLRKPAGDTVIFMVLTLWQSLDAIRAFAGAEDPEVAVVPPEAQALLLSWDARAVHWPVAYTTFD